MLIKLEVETYVLSYLSKSLASFREAVYVLKFQICHYFMYNICWESWQVVQVASAKFTNIINHLLAEYSVNFTCWRWWIACLIVINATHLCHFKFKNTKIIIYSRGLTTWRAPSYKYQYLPCIFMPLSLVFMDPFIFIVVWFRGKKSVKNNSKYTTFMQWHMLTGKLNWCYQN